MSKEKQIWEQPGYDFDPPYPASTPVITNYDSLISKTPEEMANALASVETGVNTYGDDVYYHWLSWLKSPVDKEGEG